MKFKTMKEYDNYLNEIKQDLEEIDEYLKEHPESQGTKGNYETIKHIFDIYNNNRYEFIQKLNEINLKLDSSHMNKPLSLTNMYSLSHKFNTVKNSTINLIEINLNTTEDLLIEEISKGSYNIKFSFPNPTEEDVKRTSPRKKGLMKLFDFIIVFLLKFLPFLPYGLMRIVVKCSWISYIFYVYYIFVLYYIIWKVLYFVGLMVMKYNVVSMGLKLRILPDEDMIGVLE